MRPIHLLVPAAAAAVAIASLAGSSTAAPAAKTVLTFTAKPTSGSGVDSAPKGPSVGDQFFERGTLRGSDGSAAGTYILTTQLVAGNAKKGFEHQTISLHLDNGTVLTMADMRSHDGYTVPVIGGSRAYAGATGHLRVDNGRHNTERLTLTLNQ